MTAQETLLNLCHILYSKPPMALHVSPGYGCNGPWGLHLPSHVATTSFHNTFPPSSASDTLTSLLCCPHAGHVPTSGYLLLLYALPGSFSPQIQAGPAPSFPLVFVQQTLFLQELFSAFPVAPYSLCPWALLPAARTCVS